MTITPYIVPVILCKVLDTNLLAHLLGTQIAMEGVETAIVDETNIPKAESTGEVEAPNLVEEVVKDEESNTKKRKENPVLEEEAMEEANSGRPVRSKAAKLKVADSPHDSAKSAREEAKLKREEEKRQKEEAKAEEKRKKEEEKLKRLEEKKAKEEEKEAAKRAKEEEKKAKEAEKLKKEEEKKSKEEEKRKAKEALEAEKQAKEEERKRVREQKEEEKRLKEEEKRQKEEEKRQKEEEKKAKEDAARRQSSMLMSFVKKKNSEANLTTDSEASASIAASGSGTGANHAATAKFEQVGKFLAWVPPTGVVIAPFLKWSSRSTEEEFLTAMEKVDNREKCSAWFDSWRVAARRPTRDELRSRRDASYALLARFQKTTDDTTSRPSTLIEKQRKHLVDYKTKILQIDESLRPAFFGTYSTTSPSITGRKWNGKDANLINYDVDSDVEDFALILDDEEDLEADSQGSENSEEQGSEQANEYEYDEFVVQDGALSEDEGRGLDSDDESEEGDSERQKARTALITQAKRKLSAPERSTIARTPILTGLVYNLGALSSKLQETFTVHSIRPSSSVVYNKLQLSSSSTNTSTNGAMVPDELKWWPVPLTIATTPSSGASGAVRKSTAKVIPPALVPEVAKFIHNEFESSFDRLLDKVRAAFTQASKKQLALFIREKCEKKKLPTAKNGVWLIKTLHRESFALPLDDPIPPPPATTSLSLDKNSNAEHVSDEKSSTTPKKKRASKKLGQPSIESMLSLTPKKESAEMTVATPEPVPSLVSSDS